MDNKLNKQISLWWKLNCKLLVYIFTKKLPLYVDYNNVDVLQNNEYYLPKIQNKLNHISQQLLPIITTIFKQMYEYEYMLTLLQQNTYTTHDAYVKNEIELKLKKVCNQLIHITLYALRYRMCIRVIKAVEDQLLNNTYTYKNDLSSDRIINILLNIETYKFDDVIKKEKLDNIGNEYYDIILPFINAYINNNQPLSKQLIDLNLMKHYDHFTGGIYTGTYANTHYLLGNINKQLFDDLTNINKLQIEYKLQKLLNY